MPRRRQYVSLALFGAVGTVLCALLALTTVRNLHRDRQLLLQNALTQGYWIARSLEIGHSMMVQDHRRALRDLLRVIAQRPEVRFLAVLDGEKRVVVASEPQREGQLWPLPAVAEHGTVLHRDARTLVLAFPADFARAWERMRPHHPQGHDDLGVARWVVLGLDATEAQAHYRDIVVQSVFVSLSLVALGLAAFGLFGLIQKYRLASASLERLERIRRHLARFVPATVQRLIEENPERPPLEKVEQEATVLFLDVDHYTRMAADVAPAVLNRVIERYFAAFLDSILAHGGDINETAGDGVMAIFTGPTPQAHALSAVRAARAIQEQARQLNAQRQPGEPEIQVNIGINTGPVLLGATMLRGSEGERYTYTASGLVTTVAARLCELGSGGQVHLSATTARLVQGQVAVQPLPAVSLKNLPQAIGAYRL